MTHESVVAALEAALLHDPDNLEVRLHLADLLLQDNRAGECLIQAKAVLAAQPDHTKALRLAAWAAEEVGQSEVAARYQRLHDALTGVVQGVAPALIPAAKAPVTVMGDGDDDGPYDERWDIQTSQVTLADVAGMEEVKRRLELAFLAPLRNPELLKMYGSVVRGGCCCMAHPDAAKRISHGL